VTELSALLIVASIRRPLPDFKYFYTGFPKENAVSGEIRPILAHAQPSAGAGIAVVYRDGSNQAFLATPESAHNSP
jgi:hypothetical protein